MPAVRISPQPGTMGNTRAAGRPSLSSGERSDGGNPYAVAGLSRLRECQLATERRQQYLEVTYVSKINLLEPEFYI